MLCDGFGWERFILDKIKGVCGWKFIDFERFWRYFEELMIEFLVVLFGFSSFLCICLKFSIKTLVNRRLLVVVLKWKMSMFWKNGDLLFVWYLCLDKRKKKELVKYFRISKKKDDSVYEVVKSLVKIVKIGLSSIRRRIKNKNKMLYWIRRFKSWSWRICLVLRRWWNWSYVWGMFWLYF